MATLDQRQLAQLRRQIADVERRVRLQRRRRLLSRTLALLCLLIVVLVLADVAAAAHYALAGLALARQAASVNLQSVLAQPAGLQTFQADMADAQTDLQRSSAALWPWRPLLSHAGGLPNDGPAAASLGSLLQSAGCLAGAAEEAAAVANALVGQADRSLAVTDAVQTALATLNQQKPAIAQAQLDMTCAIAARKAVDPRLDSNPGRLAPELTQLDAALAQANSIVGTLALLPAGADALLGVGGTRQYLVLGQDPFELRATGGFIGGMGLVTVANGAITKTDYRGVLEFEPPNERRLTPPAPLVKYMGLGGWYLRDANFSPDFPTAARQVEAFFKMDQGIQADGVIGVDLYAVQDILGAVGPVTVPGYAGTVNADTLLPQLWQNINASGDVTSTREQDKTDYLNALVTVLIQKLQRPDAATLPKLIGAIAQAVRQRHLLVYSSNADVEALATLTHADGAVWNGPGDGLQVVDTQVSYGKMAAMVDESLQLDVNIGADGQVTSDTLTINYANKYTERAPERVWRELHSELFNWRTGVYENAPGIMATYVRVLVPPGSTLTSVQGGDDLPGYANVNGRSQLSSYVVVRPDQQRSLVFRYVPNITGMAAGTYTLTVPKQPGTVAEPLTVRLHLPPALHVAAPPSGWKATAAGLWVRQVVLDQDQSLAFEWSFA